MPTSPRVPVPLPVARPTRPRAGRDPGGPGHLPRPRRAHRAGRRLADRRARGVRRGHRPERGRQDHAAAAAGRPRPPRRRIRHRRPTRSHRGLPGPGARAGRPARRSGPAWPAGWARGRRGGAAGGGRRTGRRHGGGHGRYDDRPQRGTRRSGRPTSTPGSTPSSRTSASAQAWPTGRRRRSRAGRRRRWRWPPSSCPASPSPCSTSRPTTSTSPGCAGWRRGLPPHGAAWSSSPTTGRSSSGRSPPSSSSTSTTTRRREYGGGWAGFLAERATPGAAPRRPTGTTRAPRPSSTARAHRQRQWATTGVARENRSTPRDNDKAQRDFRINRTEKLAAKARRTERALETLDEVTKPWEGWELRFTIGEAARAGAVVARLDGAVMERDAFVLGPLDLEIAWGDRLGITGPNGSGKSTLVGALLGTCHSAGRPVGGPERGARGAGPGPAGPRGGGTTWSGRSCDRCGLTSPRHARCWPSSASVPNG